MPVAAGTTFELVSPGTHMMAGVIVCRDADAVPTDHDAMPFR